MFVIRLNTTAKTKQSKIKCRAGLQTNMKTLRQQCHSFVCTRRKGNGQQELELDRLKHCHVASWTAAYNT